MKKIIFLSLLFLVNVFLYSENKKDDLEIDIYLNKLNKQIEIKDQFDTKKREKINLLKDKLKLQSITVDERYILTSLLFDEYSTYQNDSMYVYARKLIELAHKLDNKDKIMDAQIAFANSYLWAGLFKDAYEYANNIDTTGISKESQIEYLMLLFNIEFECGLYAKYQQYFDETYKSKISTLRLSLEKLLSQNDDKLLELKQKEYFLEGEFDKAFDIAIRRFDLKDGNNLQLSSKLGNAGYAALDSGDTITAVKYMVQASIIDIEQGSRQTPSLRMLSQAIYPLGYLNESYKYIQLAMDNARMFGSRYRMYEASIMLPTIDKDLYQKTEKQKAQLSIITIITLFFFVALLVSIFIILKQNKKLIKSKSIILERNESLLQTNSLMQIINKELIESNNIKDTYLGKTLSDNSKYITKIEDLTKTISRKLKVRQYDDITSFIHKNLYGKERENMLIAFDEMFLKLYPDFIARFNSLLTEENHIYTEDEHTLTPELRIFALIRLGITKNDVIADILDYSVSTVKNYKTKIRNASVYPNDEFDKRLKEIELLSVTRDQ